MADAAKKSLETPDETRSFDKGKVQVINIAGGAVGRYKFEPGWKWSEHVKPIAGTDLCQAAHFAYQISGRLHVVMSDGSEIEVGPGDVMVVPPGHDAWVVGNEAVTGVDWAGLGDYAVRR
ncbi:MAG: cupin domain-containing protein [Chloroflexi bacterium]|nr:cupin domain-containing protein [Chloroflexota bacterium]